MHWIFQHSRVTPTWAKAVRLARVKNFLLYTRTIMHYFGIMNTVFHNKSQQKQLTTYKVCYACSWSGFATTIFSRTRRASWSRIWQVLTKCFFLISLQQLVWRIKCKCIKHIGEISTIFCSCGRETLTKDECRSAMDHYAHSLGHCCYGRKPARDHEIKDLTSRTALRVRILRLVLASHTYCPVQLNLVCYPDYSDVQSIN